jgi:hypothetical protein
MPDMGVLLFPAEVYSLLAGDTAEAIVSNDTARNSERDNRQIRLIPVILGIWEINAAIGGQEATSHNHLPRQMAPVTLAYRSKDSALTSFGQRRVQNDSPYPLDAIHGAPIYVDCRNSIRT